MTLNRRGFFRSLLAPIVAKFLPSPKPPKFQTATEVSAYYRNHYDYLIYDDLVAEGRTITPREYFCIMGRLPMTKGELLYDPDIHSAGTPEIEGASEAREVRQRLHTDADEELRGGNLDLRDEGGRSAALLWGPAPVARTEGVHGTTEETEVRLPDAAPGLR